MFEDNFLDDYEYSQSQIEKILGHIKSCFDEMMADNKPISNNENKIRNRLIKGYLTNQKVKNKVGIKGIRFLPEVAIIDNNDDELGYTDIHVVLEPHFDNDDAVFILECKRLDGKGKVVINNLNGEYVNNGIMRFTTPIPPKTTPKYPTYFNINGMIGFCIKSFDIHHNSIVKIKEHLNKWCPNETISPLTQELFIKGFDYTYVSKHKTATSKQEFILYHLMLNVCPILNL